MYEVGDYVSFQIKDSNTGDVVAVVPNCKIIGRRSFSYCMKSSYFNFRFGEEPEEDSEGAKSEEVTYTLELPNGVVVEDIKEDEISPA